MTATKHPLGWEAAEGAVDEAVAAIEEATSAVEALTGDIEHGDIEYLGLVAQQVEEIRAALHLLGLAVDDLETAFDDSTKS